MDHQAQPADPGCPCTHLAAPPRDGGPARRVRDVPFAEKPQLPTSPRGWGTCLPGCWNSLSGFCQVLSFGTQCTLCCKCQLRADRTAGLPMQGLAVGLLWCSVRKITGRPVVISCCPKRSRPVAPRAEVLLEDSRPHCGGLELSRHSPGASGASGGGVSVRGSDRD